MADATKEAILESLRQLRLDVVASELAEATTLATERAALERAQAFVEGYALGYLRSAGSTSWPRFVEQECNEVEAAIVQRLVDLSPEHHREVITQLNHEAEPGRNEANG